MQPVIVGIYVTKINPLGSIDVAEDISKAHSTDGTPFNWSLDDDLVRTIRGLQYQHKMSTTHLQPTSINRSPTLSDPSASVSI